MQEFEKKKYNRYLASWGLTFLPPDAAVRLLGTPWNIAETSQPLFPLLDGQSTPYKEALDWL